MRFWRFIWAVARYNITYGLYCRPFGHRFCSMRYLEENIVDGRAWVEQVCGVCHTIRLEQLTHA